MIYIYLVDAFFNSGIECLPGNGYFIVNANRNIRAI